MASISVIVRAVGVLLLCHAVLGKSIRMASDERTSSSDESSSSDEGEYEINTSDVASIVEKLRGRLLTLADQAKKNVVEGKAQQSKNIIDVPINCPSGWKFGQDGECHPDFDALDNSMRLVAAPNASNIIDPPLNCPEGWLPGEDGECHPIFEFGEASASDNESRGDDNIIDPPPNCPEGWLPGEDGECHPIFEDGHEAANASEKSHGKEDAKRSLNGDRKC